MSSVRLPLNIRLRQVQPCTGQNTEHDRDDPILETLIPRTGQPNIYAALCKCLRCPALLIVATGHVPETEENVWQVLL